MIDKYANQKALEKMRRADDLEVALRVSNPGVMLTLVACAAILVGAFLWGFFGSVHTDISVTAVRMPGSSSISCVLDSQELSEISEEDRVMIKGKTFYVDSLSTHSIKRDEVLKLMAGDESVTEAVMGDRSYGYAVLINGDDMSDIDDGEILSATIIAKEQSPISLLF